MTIKEYGRQNTEVVMLLHGGGLSLGGQIAVEMLSQRPDICRYALIDSALVKPMKLTHALIEPTFGMSYGLIKQKWFAKLQAGFLGVPKAMFDDYCIECSADGENFSPMRVCHMWQGGGKIRFGIYACSPEDSSFKAVFTNMELTQCKWLAHDGQQPDEA